jgi:REP element-mobilizing transposase RayT
LKYLPEIHHRRSIRLKGYDYAQAGGYFITVCTQGRVCFFGDVTGEAMQLNEAGRMVASEWHAQANRFPTVRLDAFVVMPNHIHGIIWIENDVGAGLVPAQTAPARMDSAPAHGATTRVAPAVGDIVDGIVRIENDVGAGLVPAQTAPARMDSAPAYGATPRVAPTVGDIVDGIVRIENDVGAGLVPAQTAPARMDSAPAHRATPRVAPTIGDIVGAFKSLTTVAYARSVQQSGWPAFRGRLWQRNYYEHIIRNDESLNDIRQYILDNPLKWELDDLHPKNESLPGNRKEEPR